MCGSELKFLNTIIQMNDFVGILISLIIAIFLVLCFYYYMNFIQDTYINFDSNKIKTLPWYAPPRWIRDAWDPTWAAIQRNLIILQTKI